jgi:hypothetical protein
LWDRRNVLASASPSSHAIGIDADDHFDLSFAQTTYVIDFVDFLAGSQETGAT